MSKHEFKPTREKPHKLSMAIVKTGDDGEPVTAVALGLTKRETVEMLRGGSGHKRAGVTTNKGRKRNKVRAKMAKASRRRNG